MTNEAETQIDEKNLTSAKHEQLKLIATLVSVVVVLWLISWYLIIENITSWGDRGTFGDMFGAVNSLFSGLALAGIIYTIYVQKIELRLQRKELKMAREELHRQAIAQEQSGEAHKEQVETFKVISSFIGMSIKTTRNLNTSKAVSNILNSPEKIKIKKLFKIDGHVETIPLHLILEKISNDEELESNLEKILGDYDEICLGVQQEVYEIEIVKSSCEHPLIDIYIQFQEYIEHIRKEGHPHAWLHFEETVKAWSKEVA